MSGLYCIGYRLEDGRIGVMPRHLRRAAVRIEEADRRAFASTQIPGGLIPTLVRPSLPGEREIRQAMGSPIRANHVAMLCVMVTDGFIDRKPVTADQLAFVAEHLEGPP